MAEKIALDLIIKAEGAQTVGEIKQSIKDIKNEMLKVGENSSEFKKLANAAAQAKDKLEDTHDAINALDPGKLGSAFTTLGSKIAGGFQAAQGAMVLFGGAGKDVEKAMLKIQAATAFAQGIQSVQDLGKAFKALWVIVSANPIGLILTAIIGIGTALYLLKDKVKIIGDAFDVFASHVSYVIDKFKEFSDWLGISNFKLDELREKTKKLREETLKMSESNLERIIKNYDREIAVAQAAGENVEEIEKRKQREIIKTANEQRKLAEQTGQDAQKYIDMVLDAQNKLDVMKAAAQKKAADEALKREKEYQENLSKIQKEFSENFVNAEVALSNFVKEIKAKEAAERDQALDAEFEAWKADFDRRKEYQKAYTEASVALEQERFNGIIAAAQIGQQLFGKNKALAESFFLLEKAASIAKIVVSTQSEIAGYYAQSALQFGAAGVAIATPLAAAAKIRAGIGIASILASTISKFMNGGGAPNENAPAPPSVNAPSPPQINPVSNTSTQINQNQVDSGQGMLKAYVVETEITNTQNNVQQIVNQSIVE
jgi:hypothetical protein